MSTLLSTEHIAEQSTSVETADRRRRPRLLSRTTGWVFLGDDDHAPAREILVQDISRLGVGFIAELELAAGFKARIRVGFGPHRLARRIEITNCREQLDGTYVIGAQFI